MKCSSREENGLRRIGFGRSGAAFLLSLLTTAFVACAEGDVSAEAGTDLAFDGEVSRFAGSAGSLDVLGRTVLGGLIVADTAALERLRLTEHEHNEVVWPELPASAPEVNYPVDMAWDNIVRRNLVGRERLIADFGGRALEYGGVECRGAVETFETFVVHTDCFLLFAEIGGTEDRVLQIQAFEDVIERGGGLKIFRYYDEDVSRAPGSR